MKEFVDKLIGRLEELKDDVVDDKCPVEKNSRECEMEYACETCYLTKAINIVNELAEEYINTSTDTSIDTSIDTSSGWIPCSERLPKKSGKYLITQERYSLEDRLCKRPIAIEVDYVMFNATDNLWARASFFKVIAWQPLPAPYKKGVTENE